MNHPYFIIGTDTDCGKTYVTAQLIDALKAHYSRVLAIKPVASGCSFENDTLVSEDVRQLNAHQDECPDDALFWRLKSPISPHLAAAEEGKALTIQSIAKVVDTFRTADWDVLLIEGAGGLMVPLNMQETWVDFLIHTKIPVILVVGMRLGCINHALLTQEVLKYHGIHCVGWIANCLDPQMNALKGNIDTLTNKLSFPLIATVPFNGTIEARSPHELLSRTTPERSKRVF